MIAIDAIPAFEDNYIWLIKLGDDQAVVIDPGDARPVIATLERQQLRLTAILITHGHGDHVGGIPELVRRYRPEVYGPRHDFVPHLNHPVGEGDRVALGPLQLEVFDIPGHTAGHIAYYGHDSLFCGDTLFSVGCGKVFSSTLHQLYLSLKKIARLPTNTNVYCAHEYTLDNLRFALTVEPENDALQRRRQQARELRQQGLATIPSTLERELETNPFLRCRSATVVAAAQDHDGKSLKSEEDVFRVLRQWKDDFA